MEDQFEVNVRAISGRGIYQKKLKQHQHDVNSQQRANGISLEKNNEYWSKSNRAGGATYQPDSVRSSTNHDNYEKP